MMKINLLWIVPVFPCLLIRCMQPVADDTTADMRIVLHADDYLRDRYFFLDNVYRRAYIRKYALVHGNSGGAAPPRVVSLAVWRSWDRRVTDSMTSIKQVQVDSTGQYWLFQLLERDRHYCFNQEEGWIRLVDSVYLQPTQEIAIFMRTEDSLHYPVLQKGAWPWGTIADSSSQTTEEDVVRRLWILRPARYHIDSAEVDTTLFYLPWRHVYSYFNFDDRASLKVSVERVVDSYYAGKRDSSGKYYSDILGITRNGLPVVQNTVIFNREFNDIVFPPFDTGVAGLEPFNNPQLGPARDSLLYKYGYDILRIMKLENRYKPRFDIKISWKRARREEDEYR